MPHLEKKEMQGGKKESMFLRDMSSLALAFFYSAVIKSFSCPPFTERAR
jgi:hypothetical protein